MNNLLTEDDLKNAKIVRLNLADADNELVDKEEYIFYLRARKRLLRNEPLPESTFKDIQNSVLRRRLVRAICLKKASSTNSATPKEPTQETT